MILDIVTLIPTLVIFATTVAHVLELPGKRRLGWDDYVVVQCVFYPGFTISGMLTEIPAVAVAVAAVVAHGASARRVVVLAALVLVSVVFWTVVQPVNRWWRPDASIPGKAGHLSASQRSSIRRRWEAGHALRALAAATALSSLIVTVSL